MIFHGTIDIMSRYTISAAAHLCKVLRKINEYIKKTPFFNEVQNSSCSVYLVRQSFRERFITSLRWERILCFAPLPLLTFVSVETSAPPKHCTAPCRWRTFGTDRSRRFQERRQSRGKK